jgi:hypothetical protein
MAPARVCRDFAPSWTRLEVRTSPGPPQDRVGQSWPWVRAGRWRAEPPASRVPAERWLLIGVLAERWPQNRRPGRVAAVSRRPRGCGPMKASRHGVIVSSRRSAGRQGRLVPWLRAAWASPAARCGLSAAAKRDHTVHPRSADNPFGAPHRGCRAGWCGRPGFSRPEAPAVPMPRAGWRGRVDASSRRGEWCGCRTRSPNRRVNGEPITP